MRKISAHFILDGRGKCYVKGIISLDSDGTIVDIQDTGGHLVESEEVEFYSGIIIPGFVNAHCHLELSHLRNSYQEGSGFVPFLKSVVEKRELDLEKIQVEAEKADILMYRQGIVAVGDISNGPVTNGIKQGSKIYYHTFVEALGFAPQRAEVSFEWAKSCQRKLVDLGLKASIVPHAPYSVSERLFELIAQDASESGSILSIHSQESAEEDQMYLEGTGDMMKHLRENLSMDTTFFVPTGRKALLQTMHLLPKQNRLLLVHNLFATQEDLELISRFRDLCNTWFVLCPASNLFIQNQLPDIKRFQKNGLQICLGTDSLASNHQLSILGEIKIIQQAHPSIALDELIGWACWNGANALNIAHWAGSIEIGKRPGINLLTGVDLTARMVLPETQIKKIG